MARRQSRKTPISRVQGQVIEQIEELEGALITLEAETPSIEYVDDSIAAAIAALIDTSPATLDTLNELAAALGDDANFAATVATALAGKQPIDSDLTAIAALTTTSFGRSLLELANLAALMSALNLSGTNTGDNAVNALYSGLAASKQDTLLAGTNIKTINGATPLGPGDLVVSGVTNIKETEIDFEDGINQIDKSFTITDADVAPTSQILANIAYKSPSDGRHIDEIAAEELDVFCAPGTGDFNMLLRSRSGSVSGKFLVNYLVG